MSVIELKHPYLIAPSLLACDFSRLAEEVAALEKAGVDVLHLDVMDGHFVPNLTFGMPVIKAIRKLTKLPLDAHLMIDNPDRYLEDFAEAGCDWLSVHVEVCPHLNRTLTRIRELGMKAGVAINPGTSLSSLEAVFDVADYILLMSVNPGFGGQQFIPASLDRLRDLRRRIGERPVRIEIDGGIKESNLAEVVSAGAEILVMGTGLLSASDYKEAVNRLRKTGDRK